MNPTDYYTIAAQHHKPGRIFPRWNWAAFVFGPTWLAYRRCYLYTVLFFAVYLFALWHYKEILPIYSLIIRLMFGFFGTSLYLRVWRTSQKTHIQHTTVLWMVCVMLIAEFASVLISAHHTPDSSIVDELSRYYSFDYMYRFWDFMPTHPPEELQVQPNLNRMT